MRKLIIKIGLMAVIFAIFGIALGILAFVAGSWAQTQLIADAGGHAADFGPVFVSVSFLQTAIILFFMGPLVAAVVGGLIGGTAPDPKGGLVIGGVGSLVGFYLMSVIALLFLVLSKGQGTDQALTFGQALRPMLIAGIPTAIIGAVISALGSAVSS